MTSLLSTVRAQPTAVDTLASRARGGPGPPRLPLRRAPTGVGKERAAFGLAQALVCERRAAGSLGRVRSVPCVHARRAATG